MKKKEKPMNKKWIYLLSVILLVGCMAGHKIMTMESFSEVMVGTSEQDLEKKVGKPYKVTKIDDNVKVYEYIERVEVGGRVIEERHYLFTIENGQVTSKKMKFEGIRDDRDAFELQTSLNEKLKEE